MSRGPGEVVLRREDDGRVICESCTLADTFRRRSRGLLGRKRLDPGEGLVLRPEWSVHTFFMRFPIDVIFVDKNQVVVKIVPTLKPWRTAICHDAHEVVELPAGECERLGLRAGDRLAWAARPNRPQLTLATVPDRTPKPSASSDASDGETAEPRATRVLIGTDDEQFLRLARFLLTRRRFEVDGTKRVAKLVDLVERQGADVVVIDATRSLGDAARTVAAIEALHPEVRAVVVCEGEPPRWTNGLKVTKKWDALETLPQELAALAENARAWS
jgi:uncharacterized membrane protein (UPF0127 family)